MGLPHRLTFRSKKKAHFAKGGDIVWHSTNLRLRAEATIAIKTKFVKVVQKIILTKRSPRHADSDVYRCFDDALDPYVLVVVRKIDWKDGTQSAHEEWIKKLRFTQDTEVSLSTVSRRFILGYTEAPCYSKTVHSD